MFLGAKELNLMIKENVHTPTHMPMDDVTKNTRMQRKSCFSANEWLGTVVPCVLICYGYV